MLRLMVRLTVTHEGQVQTLVVPTKMHATGDLQHMVRAELALRQLMEGEVELLLEEEVPIRVEQVANNPD